MGAAVRLSGARAVHATQRARRAASARALGAGLTPLPARAQERLLDARRLARPGAAAALANATARGLLPGA
jgi:hypothetical protein